MDTTVVPQQQRSASISCQAHAADAAAYTDVGALPASSDLQDSSLFSIRGYVAAVRKIDITRCWPFSQKLLEESIQAQKDPLLPPLSPYACDVKLQQEYYDVASHVHMDAACNVNSGPQLQVQIDVSKFEPRSRDASKPEELPVECNKFAPQAAWEDCSPHKERVHKHENPFLDGILAFKRQAPRSIREIRKSVMQGCQCFRTMRNGFCTNDTCNTSEHKGHMNGGVSCMVKERNENVKKHFALKENVSSITEVECHGKDADQGQSHVGNQVWHVDRGPGNVDNLHQDALGAAVQINSLYMYHDAYKSNLVAEKNPVIPEASTNSTLHVNLSSKACIDCSLDSQKSMESQNSLYSRPHFDAASTQEDTFDMLLSPDSIPQQRCPVCLLFQCSSNTALNAHIDRCLVASSTEVVDKCSVKLQKGKVRKKRSMAELCQVAPPCVRAGELDPFAASSSTSSQKLKEKLSTDFPKRKRTKLVQTRDESEVATIAGGQDERNRRLIKSQANALRYLQWRSRSALSRRDLLQTRHGETRRSASHEARIANLSKLRLRSRQIEMKACTMLRKKHWKGQTIIHEPAAVSKQATHKITKLMHVKKKKCVQELQKDVRQFLSTLSHTDILKGVLHNNRPTASDPPPSRKRKPSKQTANVETPDAVVTVKGSHKTTLKILRPKDAANKELNQAKKIHFRVHVKPAKKQRKHRTTVAAPLSVQNRESMTNISNEDPTDGLTQTSFIDVTKTFRAARSTQANFGKESSSNYNILRRIVEKGLIPQPSSSVMSARLGDVRMLPSTPLLHSDAPSTKYAGRSRTEDITRCCTDIDDEPLLSRHAQPEVQRYSGACATGVWQSLVRETRQDHMMDSWQAQAAHLLSHPLPHNRVATMQKGKEFPFSLCGDKLSHWPQDPRKRSSVIKSSDGTVSARAACQIRPEQVAKLAQMLSASNRHRQFAANQDTIEAHAVVSQTGIKFSESERANATHQLNQGSPVHISQSTAQNVGGSQLETWQAQSAPQRLPAWMQAAIREQRSSAMPPLDLPTSSASQSIVLNTTPCATREISRPSPTGNPVLRLMGKTMVLMPESHHSQVDRNTSLFNGSSNYINFFQLLDSEDAGGKQQQNIDRIYSSDIPEGIASQDYRCNNGVQSWINTSTPQLQNFFVQIPSSSSTGRIALAHQQASPQFDGRNLPGQDRYPQWSHARSSSVPSGSPHTNWQTQKVPSTFYQPQSEISCQHGTMVPGPPFCEKEISSWKQKHSAPYRTLNPGQNSTDLNPQYPQTPKNSTLPCWLSSINRANQPATTIVLDEEGPYYGFDTSTLGALEKESMLGSRSGNQQMHENYWLQTRAKISDPCHWNWETQQCKTFIPIIYTVDSNLGDSCCAPQTMGLKFQKLSDMDQGCGASSRKKMSCLDPTKRAWISSFTGEGGSPLDVIRVGANSHSIVTAPAPTNGLQQIPSVEVVCTSTRGTNPPPENVVLGKTSNALQQDVNIAKPSSPLQSQIPRMTCRVNMNPAEVDCQDTGQFMSTPMLVSSFSARPASDRGLECMENSRIINANLQAQGLSSSQVSLPTDTIFNTVVPSLEPTADTSLQRGDYMFAGSTIAKATGNGTFIFNFSKNPSASEDLSARATLNMPSSVNTLADGRTDAACMVQECSSSRMQALKVAGKFKIMNGRVSVIRKDMQTNVGDTTATEKQSGRISHTSKHNGCA
ncbi:hypothetical protein L7F22_022475 [Adiantum nelumboides]|nr:hypothetical protein [Adiantum nelumboides]